MIVLGLRAAVAAQGSHLEASMLGKWKATVQFVAIALVMLRPDVVIGGVLLDQWALIVAAIVTVWSGVDYFVSFSSALRERYVSRVFVTGGSGVVGRALVERLVAGATRSWRCPLAPVRGDAAGAGRRARPRRAVRRGRRSPRRWPGAR